MRGLGAALALCLAGMASAEPPERVTVTGPPSPDLPDLPAWPVEAVLEGPTDRYPHNVLGDIPAFTRLEVTAMACGECAHWKESAQVRLDPPLVFEDVAPRLWDIDGDGRPEILVVESHEQQGARLAVWSWSDTGAQLSRRGASAFIGTRFRWLAPAGVGDFAGDGGRRVAWVDRPHLAREGVFARLTGDRPVEIARAPGFSSHRIGETAIASAVRSCGGRDEVLLPRATGRRLAALRLEGGRIVARDAGPFSGPGDLARAARC
ncbi:MAG TPA: VCBS repeat-containing protein [Paracoccaceae bacterium]|nr:VCBS repeat-containing protein [Paracoccaceae bacterium]